jgi:hypothetical protein
MNRCYKPRWEEKFKQMDRAELIECLVLSLTLLILIALFLFADIAYFRLSSQRPNLK